MTTSVPGIFYQFATKPYQEYNLSTLLGYNVFWCASVCYNMYFHVRHARTIDLYSIHTFQFPPVDGES